MYILTTDRPATDRPTDDDTTDDRPLILKISNGQIFATGCPIHSMFGSREGFSGTADLMALFPAVYFLVPTQATGGVDGPEME